MINVSVLRSNSRQCAAPRGFCVDQESLERIRGYSRRDYKYVSDFILHHHESHSFPGLPELATSPSEA